MNDSKIQRQLEDSGFVTDKKNNQLNLGNSSVASRSGVDRYAPIKESELGEEELKRMIHSPLSKNSKIIDSKLLGSKESIKNSQVPPQTFKFDSRRLMQTQTPISGDDIAFRPTFAEIDKRDNSSMLTVPIESHISHVDRDQVSPPHITGFHQQANTAVRLFNQESFSGPQRKEFARTKPVLKQEEDRTKKLENLKEYVQFKRVVEYESETIELYDMMSSEFDYEDVRLNSPCFIIKQYKDSLYRGEVNANKKREGRGVIVYETGRIFEGTWLADKRHGKGFELFPNGNTFHGEYLNGKPQGKGVYTWTNGEVFDGEWMNGQKEGNGIWKGINGESYIG